MWVGATWSKIICVLYLNGLGKVTISEGRSGSSMLKGDTIACFNVRIKAVLEISTYYKA